MVWLDELAQVNLPVDLVHVLCVLAATSGHVPNKTPLSETAEKWFVQAEVLLRYEHEQNLVRHTNADHLIATRMRLINLGKKDAVDLVPRAGPSGFRQELRG